MCGKHLALAANLTITLAKGDNYMLTSQSWKTTLFFLTIAATFGLSFVYFSFADSDSDSKNGASCSATATHYANLTYTGVYNHTQWAGFSASLSKEGRKAGDSEDGSYEIYAHCEGAPDEESHTFTLTIKKKFFFGPWLKDDSTMDNVNDEGMSSWSGTMGSSSAQSSCGKAATRRVHE